MIPKILVCYAVCAATALSSQAVAGEAGKNPGGVKLSATLSGAAEVDAQGNPDQGDLDGTGSFVGRVNPGQGQVCYTLTWNGIEAPGAAHIHVGAAGVNGNVAVPLSLEPGKQCATVTRELAMEIIKSPADYYVNVHNGPFPAGALRGQLTKSSGQ